MEHVHAVRKVWSCSMRHAYTSSLPMLSSEILNSGRPHHYSALYKITHLNDSSVTTVRVRPMRDTLTPMMDMMFNASCSALERG